jgi:hypothetical protein
MHGTPTIHFDELFADTVTTFGVPVAWELYRRSRMTRREFRFWCLSCHNRGLI